MDKSKKIVLILMIILIVLTGVLSVSFAWFRKEKLWSNVNINLDMNINFSSVDLVNNRITIAANGVKEINVDFENTSTIDGKYQFYYKMISPTTQTSDIIVAYSHNDDPQKGEINAKEKKRFSFIIDNYSTQSVTIEIGMVRGFKKNELINPGLEFVAYTKARTWTYSYTGAVQTFEVPIKARYKIELWGAKGGDYEKLNRGGNGGYTSGIIQLTNKLNSYIYVGGRNDVYDQAIFNGSIRGSSGGATDIRLVSGDWKNFDSLKSRIMVAAGGGYYYNIHDGFNANAYGGGLIGGNGNNTTGGSQTAPGINRNSSPHNGKFGIGGPGYGGGNGYYGGGGGLNSYSSGGSSFISGHNGCDAIDENSIETGIIHTGQSIHYSGLYFTDTVMIDGAGYKWTNVRGSYTGMPNYAGTGTMVGNTGTGYAKITYLGK